MKFKMIFVFLISMFSFLNVTKAQCSYDENVRLSSYASNIKVGFEYAQFGRDIRYTIDILNLIPELKFEISNSNDREIIKINGIQGNYSYGYNVSHLEVTHNFKIYANSYNCNDILLRTINLTTPKFNRYSLRSECTQYHDFDLCQKFNPQKIDDAKFLKELDKKINSRPFLVDDEENDKVEKFTILGFIKNNSIILLVIIVFIVGIVVLLKYRENKKIGF